VGKGAAELQQQVHELQAQLAASKQQEERSAQQLREETFKANRLQVSGSMGLPAFGVCAGLCGGWVEEGVRRCPGLNTYGGCGVLVLVAWQLVQGVRVPCERCLARAHTLAVCHMSAVWHVALYL
jgi:hypothetical protein